MAWAWLTRILARRGLWQNIDKAPYSERPGRHIPLPVRPYGTLDQEGLDCPQRCLRTVPSDLPHFRHFTISCSTFCSYCSVRLYGT